MNQNLEIASKITVHLKRHTKWADGESLHLGAVQQQSSSVAGSEGGCGTGMLGSHAAAACMPYKA